MQFCEGYWENNVNTWTELEIISFNGENILFYLRIITEGMHAMFYVGC
jgi:hypothetical protein